MEQSIRKSGYIYCLDFIKGIACICVVFMHCEFPGILGTLVQAVSRFCVPLFFMVSGYFCYYENKNKARSSIKKIMHILKITAAATAFYILIYVLQLFIGSGTINLTARSIFNWIIFNQPVMIAGQMWFLFALLYVYIIYAVVNRFNLFKATYLLIPILIIVYIVAAQGMHLMGKLIPNMYYRNFLIEGFPFFMSGHYIHKNKSKFNCSNKLLVTVIICSALLCIVERYMLGRDFGVNICTFPQVTALFLYAINNPEQHRGVIQRLGKNCSMLVYILHPFVWHIFERIYAVVGIADSTIAVYAMPIIVLFVTIGFSLLCNCVAGRVKGLRGRVNA